MVDVTTMFPHNFDQFQFHWRISLGNSLAILWLTNVSLLTHIQGFLLTGAHFGPKKGYILGSLFKQARYKIVICALLYSVIEYYCYNNKNILALSRQYLDLSVVLAII